MPTQNIRKAMPLNMINGQLITNEILDKRVLQAMAEVPREWFVPAQLKGAAYVDDDLHVGNGRFLPAPLTFARLIQAAEITLKCRVLNIGCLSGYTAAVLSQLAAHVTATESDPALAEEARAKFREYQITNVQVETVKSLAEGFSAAAPYDVIILSGSVEYIPDTLATQISLNNGRLVGVRRVSTRPGIEGGLGKGIIITRISGQLHEREMFDDATPLLPGFEQKAGFRF